MAKNNVTMTVTNKKVGYSFLRNCGDENAKDRFGDTEPSKAYAVNAEQIARYLKSHGAK